MRLTLNILWFIVGSGLLLAIAYGIAAPICFALVVTIPFGVANLKLVPAAFWPLGREIVELD